LAGAAAGSKVGLLAPARRGVSRFQHVPSSAGCRAGSPDGEPELLDAGDDVRRRRQHLLDDRADFERRLAGADAHVLDPARHVRRRGACEGWVPWGVTRRPVDAGQGERACRESSPGQRGERLATPAAPRCRAMFARPSSLTGRRITPVPCRSQATAPLQARRPGALALVEEVAERPVEGLLAEAQPAAFLLRVRPAPHGRLSMPIATSPCSRKATFVGPNASNATQPRRNG
jgi:hypothetical protein